MANQKPGGSGKSSKPSGNSTTKRSGRHRPPVVPSLPPKHPTKAGKMMVDAVRGNKWMV